MALVARAGPRWVGLGATHLAEILKCLACAFGARLMGPCDQVPGALSLMLGAQASGHPEGGRQE